MKVRVLHSFVDSYTGNRIDKGKTITISDDDTRLSLWLRRQLVEVVQGKRNKKE